MHTQRCLAFRQVLEQSKILDLQYHLHYHHQALKTCHSLRCQQAPEIPHHLKHVFRREILHCFQHIVAQHSLVLTMSLFPRHLHNLLCFLSSYLTLKGQQIIQRRLHKKTFRHLKEDQRIYNNRMILLTDGLTRKNALTILKQIF
ncbi:uncharacterized protein LOC112461876 [Temnothorax curvispinosus]|uniref:Uncharacterized protein LOC112461876 n=1 Tax=Temnothorax curvispinosus TaxID=300111 RepID=A0A6J1QKR3_9HYME|nr:uncharacterized protein LOC112461876 [Temnothorax curvispinosus]